MRWSQNVRRSAVGCSTRNRQNWVLVRFVSGNGCRFNRDLRFELDNPAATFCSLLHRSPSERSVAELCASSFLGNRTDGQDLNSALGRVHVCLYFYVPAVDPA